MKALSINGAVLAGGGLYTIAVIGRGNANELLSQLSKERPFILAMLAFVGIGLVERYSPGPVATFAGLVRNLAIGALLLRAVSNGDFARITKEIGDVFNPKGPKQ